MSPKVGAATIPTASEITAAVWAAAARTLTAFNAQALFDLPLVDSTYAAQAEPVSGGGAGVFGSWVELLADVGVGKRLLWVLIGPRTQSETTYELEIGEGAAGSEAAITRFTGFTEWATAVGSPSLPLWQPWRSLTNNARLSCRIKDTAIGALTYGVRIGMA